ncbi:exodeoxyribonuclease VII small subunit [Agathobaculum sp.]|uniref:exodeoxyribonuclease VII small subunit n=1 Tax=Agathobaculum sp. TaxID=2048138 RepID=UPI002A81B2CC|nr:exodeoxyribonuclease VII small subunit [Agathobaculum sp.]MDY3618519.1 exodeoxyribonuclease VII small subunit [Agathobaculum sp.]
MAAAKTFESQMARLEEIVRLLEKGEAPLADSMKLFEEGTKLSAALGKLLDTAEQKVTVMLENSEGELVEQPFEAEDAER